MSAVLICFIIMLGLCTGSFLNVCIHRIPLCQSVVYRPSHCPVCKERLGGRDLIPVLSYLVLQGKCRYCGARISPRYPLVEVFTGIVFLLVFLKYGTSIVLTKYLILSSVLIIISFIDLDHKIIPNRLAAIIFVWGFMWQIILPEISWLNALAGSLIGGGLLILAAVLSKGGMGGGDIKLMLAAGFILGAPMTGVALFLSFLSGALAGLTLIIFKRVSRKEKIAFGPFLCLGIFTAAIWGNQILSWYLNIAGFR